VPRSAPRWFTSPKTETVTHPGTNRAWRRVTMLIETNALLATRCCVSTCIFDSATIATPTRLHTFRSPVCPIENHSGLVDVVGLLVRCSSQN